MDRPARLSDLVAAMALLAPAGCADHSAAGPRFVPTGRIVEVWHIGFIGVDCEMPAGPLAIEALTDRGVFRVSNPAAAPVAFHYDWAASFGDYQMLFIRFRDGAGNLIGTTPAPLAPDRCGWWSPKVHHASVQEPDEWPERRVIAIPASGHVDIPIDHAALGHWWAHGHRGTAQGPCTMQVRLFGYPGPRTLERLSAETGWIPAPCPRGYPATAPGG